MASRNRKRPSTSPGHKPGLDAFRRHGGTHQDQYRTAKQARLDGRDAVVTELEAMEDEADEIWRHIADVMADE